MANEDRFLTTLEVAERLRCETRWTVSNWIRAGKLKAYRPAGHRWLVKESDLQAFIEANVNGTPGH